jgi:hypothetical protein
MGGPTYFLLLLEEITRNTEEATKTLPNKIDEINGGEGWFKSHLTKRYPQ